MTTAVVTLSGGQDSTVCLVWALQNFDKVFAVGFRYGQRHDIELEQASMICKFYSIPYTILNIDTFSQIGGSSLLDPLAKLPKGDDDNDAVPSTFVPGRNLIFLTYAGAFAYQKKIHNLVCGVNQADYSGYPDCRMGFIASAEQTLLLAMEFKFKIHVPLMDKNKDEIWKYALELGCLDVIIKNTHTCYAADRTILHPWGYGCGECNACTIRKVGFYKAFPEITGK